MRRIGLMLLIVGFTLVMGAESAQARAPFGSWLVLPGNPSHGYVEVAHHPTLNPTAGFTFEAWVSISNNLTGEDCRSIAGKNYLQAWWIGLCNVGGEPTLRSYLKGGSSARNGGVIPRNEWTHIAVTFDGATRRHYINGVLTTQYPETGTLTTSTDPVRIGSDVSWQFTPAGAIDEVRLWSVARTQPEINTWRGVPINTAQAGLVAVWSLDGDGQDVVGGHDGTAQGIFSFEGNPDPPAGAWLTSPEIPGFQFKVRITPPGDTPIAGTRVNDCIDDTLCVRGAVAGRSEVFLRVIGPRPNGFLWPTVIRFTPSQVEVWVEQISTGQINYYLLEAQAPDNEILEGLNDRTGFLP
jgi:hypothetical protein